MNPEPTGDPLSGSGALGGGYAESLPDPGPTVEAVLQAARPGSVGARLVVLCGPPGVGKSAAAARLVRLVPDSLVIEKDLTAAGFILQAAAARGSGTVGAYGTPEYWACLRPLEYGGATAQACANLVGRRLVFLVGGWGPELGVATLWIGLTRQIAPARLSVVHLDPPEHESWRSRLAGRGSRTDSPWFESFTRSVTSVPVWPGAARISTAVPLHRTVQGILAVLPVAVSPR